MLRWIREFHGGEIEKGTMNAQLGRGLLNNLFLGESIVKAAIIEAPMSQSIPLGAGLCVEGDTIIL